MRKGRLRKKKNKTVHGKKKDGREGRSVLRIENWRKVYWAGKGRWRAGGREWYR